MSEKLESVTEALGEGALEGLKHLRAYLTYQGENPTYYKKAKVGGVLVASYVKAEATRTNRMAIEQAKTRLNALEGRS